MERSDIMATGSINISSNISRNTLLSAYAPKPCKNLTTIACNSYALIQWEDPDDYTSSDNVEITWKYTRIVRKTGSFPINENDGTIVTTSSIRNQYKTNFFRDQNLTNGETYYYAAFPCASNGTFNREQVRSICTPLAYKIMSVIIDFNNSNPATCGSYADDAVDMESGKTESAINMWQKFFGYKPCLFKNGSVFNYLNPNDYTKFENGSSANISSTSTGDVMVEFPRRGIRFTKNGNKVKISMTDNPNDPEFTYYAHKRGNVNKNNFYLGAYLAYDSDEALYSISDYRVDNSSSRSGTLSDKYFKARYRGDNYGLMTFYQFTYIQAMYMLQFKGNMDFVSAVGREQSSSDYYMTGILNTKGLIYGANYYYTDENRIKLFGLESICGRRVTLLDGVYIDKSFHLKTTTDTTIINTDAYNDIGDFSGGYTGGNAYGLYPMNFPAKTESGFLSTYEYSGGSSSTYFCTQMVISKKSIPHVRDTMFYIDFDSQFTRTTIPSSGYSGLSFRLMYL